MELVDSEDGSLSDLLALLSQAGYAVAGMWSGLEALALLRTRKFDVLLIDDYLLDLYIGDFLERLSHLSIRPQVMLMHDGTPIVDIQSTGYTLAASTDCVALPRASSATSFRLGAVSPALRCDGRHITE